MAIRSSGFGVSVTEKTLAVDPANDIISHEYTDQLSDEDDVARIRAPEVELDVAATAQLAARAHEAFDGILRVRMQGWPAVLRALWTYGMAQILLSTSPAMFEEFEVPYAARWYERFGLADYGCCDPLHDRSTSCVASPMCARSP